MKSWKTSLAGVLTLATGVAVAMGWIDTKTAAALGTVFVGFGLTQSKDNNVTGGSVKQ